ncbi:hypothetical protein P12x_003247 [Tundrisphaera lichenicola]|uniref:hypothetical protein n=1 Tax=Tundrisphaera lichenicola TaxID=2029860 RepID=UPI003EB77C9F
MRPDRIRESLVNLLENLGGRAAGAWRIEGGRLVLVAFEPAPDLAPEVAIGFEESTRSVDLSMLDLGIVRAVSTGEVAVSIAGELPPETGSGRWLRAFSADRSIAVPVLEASGKVEGVVSIALGLQPSSEVVEAAIRVMVRN